MPFFIEMLWLMMSGTDRTTTPTLMEVPTITTVRAVRTTHILEESDFPSGR